jgi:hypothetical protein
MFDLSAFKDCEDNLSDHHYKIKEFHEINMHNLFFIIDFETTAINNEYIVQEWKIESKNIKVCHIFNYPLCFLRHYIDHASYDNKIQE